MDRKTELLLDTVTTIFLIIALLMLIVNNPDGPFWLFGAAILFLLLSILRNFIWPISLASTWGLWFIIAQSLLGFAMNIGDNSFVSQIFLFVLLGETSFSRSARFSIGFALACVLAFGLGRWIHEDFPPFSAISYVVPRSLEYLAIALLGHFAKRMLDQKQQLTAANERLHQAALELEENILLRERTRVSREIHDTVGHTLTTALIGLRAGIHTLQHDQQAAAKMLGMVENHLQKGLAEARQTVHLFSERHTFWQFIPSLEALLTETCMQTGVIIHADISPDLPPLGPRLEMILYRALQEGLTNGIRHGQSRCFRLSITIENGHVVFLLTDDGIGVKGPITFGFGLTSMRERVVEAGGILKVENAPDHGVQLHITIPLPASNEVT
ncbi:sensor histidine kinase [Brevibacillus borstelensis]|uniref:sensor histidine kinase n=1 Tax=Brevibacillus borstelensis TaxID=45462 RepID=UPI0030BAD66C